MNNQTDPDQVKYGIAGLPKRWAVVVQLVGTFGLAVFLVLYYVLIMRPAETARYEQLEAAVTGLMEVVEKQQTLLEGEQADRLEELFVAAVTSDFCIGIAEASAQETSLPDIKRSLEDTLMRNVSLLRGLTRRDGRQVSEMLANKIRVSEMATEAYERVTAWNELAATAMVRECRHYVDNSLQRLRMAK